MVWSRFGLTVDSDLSVPEQDCTRKTKCLRRFLPRIQGTITRKDVPTLYQKKKNGVDENEVRRVNECASSVLVQSGMHEVGGEKPCKCSCHPRNTQDLLADGNTPDERRFDTPFDGTITPFKAEIVCHPTSPKDRENLHHIGPKSSSWTIPQAMP